MSRLYLQDNIVQLQNLEFYDILMNFLSLLSPTDKIIIFKIIIFFHHLYFHYPQKYLIKLPISKLTELTIPQH